MNANEKKLQEKFKRILRDLLKQEGNRYCADCLAKCIFLLF